MDSFNSVFHECFPLVKYDKKRDSDHGKPWFTTGLKKILSNSNSTNYKKYKNKFTHLLRISKKNYFAQKFKESASNIRSTWKIINQLLNKTKATSVLPSQFLSDGRIINNLYDISCSFNHFFVNVGVSLSNRIKKTAVCPLDYL